MSDPQPPDVRSVLDEIGVEEAAARLEARLSELEQEVARSENRIREHEQARRGELDVMRARVDDALGLVRETLDEQRETWAAFSERFTTLVDDSGITAARRLDALRDELAPRVEQALHHTDEAANELRGALDAVDQRGAERSAELSRRLLALADDVRRSADERAALLERVREERELAVHELDERARARTEQVAATAQRRADEVTERTEALRRELDAAVGELRAGQNLRAQELAEALATLHTELGERLDEQLAGTVELERRWIDGTRDIARRIEETDATIRRSLAEERASRAEMDDELVRRLDDVAGVVEQLHARVATEVTRRQSELDQLRRDDADLSAQLGVVTGRVERLFEDGGELANRVASLGGAVDALRESTGRHGQRLATLEGIEDRLGELDRRVDDVTASARDANGARLDELERAVAALRDRRPAPETELASATQLHEVAAAVAALTSRFEAVDGLRHEIRELAARTSELTTRVTAAEELAGKAAQAIASAVRRSRQRTDTPRQPGEPAAPVLMRDREGQPIVGLEYLSARRTKAEAEVEDLLALDEHDGGHAG